MLSLKDIKKDYVVGDSTVSALKGVSIDFRENEFVSILGPSGCGKTTLLNIIGALTDIQAVTLTLTANLPRISRIATGIPTETIL